MYDLNRFIKVQERDYERAKKEIQNGRKETHWIWYIFPQLKGLGNSEMANFYGIKNKEEAISYFNHPILRTHLLEISECLLNIQNKSVTEIMGYPDDLKVKSSMTLFDAIEENSIFASILEKYYNGEKDEITLRLLK